MTASWHKKLFLPGPTEVHPDVLARMAEPMIPHRGPAMRALLARIQPILRSVFQTTEPVHSVTAAATAVMEAAIRNLAATRVLAVNGGAFAARWAEAARACGRDITTLDSDPRRPIQPEDLDKAVRSARYDAVTIVHSETSTGVLAPLDDLCDVMSRHPDTLLLVDAVSSLGGVRVPTARCDFVLTASQKCLGLPPGLSFFALSARALERACRTANRGIAFDFVAIDRRTRAFEPVFTPAIPVLFAADEGLARLAAETPPVRYARHRACADFVRARLEGHLAFFIPPDIASPSLSVLEIPQGRTAGALCEILRSRHGFEVADGYGSLRDRTLRLGHMGEITPTDLAPVLDALIEAARG